MTDGPGGMASTHQEMTKSMVFDVVGTPAPQGSKTFKGFRGGKPILVESCAAVKPWRQAVVAAARNVMLVEGWTMPIGPVTVGIEFFLDDQDVDLPLKIDLAIQIPAPVPMVTGCAMRTYASRIPAPV